MKKYMVKGSGLTIEDLINVTRHNYEVELDTEAKVRIENAVQCLRKKSMLKR